MRQPSDEEQYPSTPSLDHAASRLVKTAKTGVASVRLFIYYTFPDHSKERKN